MEDQLTAEAAINQRNIDSIKRFFESNAIRTSGVLAITIQGNRESKFSSQAFPFQAHLFRISYIWSNMSWIAFGPNAGMRIL